MAEVHTAVGEAPLGVTCGQNGSIKRLRSQSTAELQDKSHGGEIDVAQPLLVPHFHEPMVQYLPRLKAHVEEAYGGVFSVVPAMEEDGLYLHKRPVRVMGEALGQAAFLEQAGTVFHHVVVYVKAGDKLMALDYGPEGDVDMTSNWTQAVPCARVLQSNPDPPNPGVDLPLLHIHAPHHALDHPAVQQAIDFVESRQYRAILNNCMQNCDALVRVITGGLIRNAPLVYDVMCGRVPQQESPLLLMFLLMTKMSWFQVCDAAVQMSAFLSMHACPAPLEDLAAEFRPQQPAPHSTAHRDKHARGDVPPETPAAAAAAASGNINNNIIRSSEANSGAAPAHAHQNDPTFNHPHGDGCGHVDAPKAAAATAASQANRGAARAHVHQHDPTSTHLHGDGCGHVDAPKAATAIAAVSDPGSGPSPAHALHDDHANAHANGDCCSHVVTPKDPAAAAAAAANADSGAAPTHAHQHDRTATHARGDADQYARTNTDAVGDPHQHHRTSAHDDGDGHADAHAEAGVGAIPASSPCTHRDGDAQADGDAVVGDNSPC